MTNYKETQCTGHIDSLKAVVGVEGTMNIRGWVYLKQEKQVADSVYAVTKEKDKLKWQRLSTVNRPDVGKHFNDKSLNNSGYSGLFSGTKESLLELGLKIDEVYYLCKK